MGVEEGQCLLGVSRKEDMISILQQNNPNVIVAIKDGGMVPIYITKKNIILFHHILVNA